MAEVPIPFSQVDVDKVDAEIDEHGQMRLSELKEELEETGGLGNALLELVERGDVSLLAVNDVVVIRSE